MATWYTLYKTSDGELKGHTGLESNLPDPLPADRSTREDEGRQDQTKDWDAATAAWVARPKRTAIPIVDFLRIQKTHPDLFSPDREMARKATIKFFNSTEGKPYRVQRA